MSSARNNMSGYSLSLFPQCITGLNSLGADLYPVCNKALACSQKVKVKSAGKLWQRFSLGPGVETAIFAIYHHHLFCSNQLNKKTHT